MVYSMRKYGEKRNSKREEPRKRDQICGRILNFAKIEPHAPLLVVSLNQKWAQLSINHFLSELRLLSPCRYHSPLTLKVTKGKCYSFSLRKFPKCPCLAFLGLFGPFCFLKNRAWSLFSTPWSLTSCKKTKKTYGWKYENFGDTLTGGLTDWLMDKTDFSGQCVQIVLAYLTLWSMVEHSWLVKG